MGCFGVLWLMQDLGCCGITGVGVLGIWGAGCDGDGSAAQTLWDFGCWGIWGATDDTGFRVLQDHGDGAAGEFGVLGGKFGCWGPIQPPQAGPTLPSPAQQKSSIIFRPEKADFWSGLFPAQRMRERGGRTEPPQTSNTPLSSPVTSPPPPLSGAGGGTEGALGGQTEGRGGGGGGVEGGTDGQTDSTPTDPPPVPPPPQFLTGGRGEWPVVAAWPRPPAAIGCGPFPPFPRRFMNERGGGLAAGRFNPFGAGAGERARRWGTDPDPRTQHHGTHPGPRTPHPHPKPPPRVWSPRGGI